MEYVWSEEDVKCGIYVCYPMKRFDPNSCSMRLYKIGFIGGRSKGVVLIAMSDGLVCSKKTPKQMAEHLTERGMMPAPHGWVIKALEYMRDWYMQN